MGFEILTGGAKKRYGRLEEIVLQEIQVADWVVVMFCPRSQLTNGKYSTSPWVLEEKGAAVALGKNFQILAHEDVDDNEIGGLHGSAYRIRNAPEAGNKHGKLPSNNTHAIGKNACYARSLEMA